MSKNINYYKLYDMGTVPIFPVLYIKQLIYILFLL